MAITELENEMGWIDVRDTLPEDGEVVLIYTNETNVFGHGGRLMREHVATFCKGRTAAEVAASGWQEFADECGNNHHPFRWTGDGPYSWWGQEVTHWARIVPPNANARKWLRLPKRWRPSYTRTTTSGTGPT